MVIIQAIEFANGEECPHAGQYLESFDFEAHNGQGFAVFTKHIDRAMTFPSAAEALEFYRRQSVRHPLRPDGKPNRPMTGLTVMIERIP